ncbi:MAG: alpha/beta fold hydrolase [Treponemataceae bacterium]
MSGSTGQETVLGSKRGYWVLLTVSLVLMLAGSAFASWINSGAGMVSVSEKNILDPSGYRISAYLYTPKAASPKKPAPGVLVVHGLNNEKKYMSNTALELARRGYVVLSMDQPGHGRSSGANGDNGGGAVGALNYLRSLPFVDKENIGLIGMSQGGFLSATNAAFALRDSYKSIFYMDSEVNYPGSPDLSRAEGLKNAAFSIGKITELGVMIFVGKGSDAPNSPMLKPIFGTQSPIEVGKVYGSIENGTARILYQHWGTHPGSTDSPVSISYAIEWMQKTLKGGSDLSPSNQIWMWKSLMNMLALLGSMVFLFPMGALLLGTPYFKTLVEKVPEYKGLRGTGWWIGALITTAVGPLLYITVWQNMFFAPLFAPNRIWPQSFTNIYMVWAFVVGLITIALLLINHFFFTKKNGACAVNYGLRAEGEGIHLGKVFKSLLLAVCIILPVYLILAFVEAVWYTDFRVWIVSLMPMSAPRFRAFLGYLIPFLVPLAAQGVLLAGFLRVNEGKVSLGKEMVVNGVVLTAGALVWILLLYIPLMAGKEIMLASGPLGATAAGMGGIYYIPLLVFWPLAGSLYTYFFRKTGRVFIGVFLVTIFLVWHLTALGVFAYAPNW